MMELEEAKEQHSTQAYPMTAVFNTLDESTTDHHPHQSQQQFLSKREEEQRRPKCDSQDGQHCVKKDKQQHYDEHSISNNLGANSKCDFSPFSISSTSSSVVIEQKQNNKTEINTNQENQIVQHHHHHHHHHYHHYYNNNNQSNAIINQGDYYILNGSIFKVRAKFA